MHHYYICYGNRWSVMLLLQLVGDATSGAHVRWQTKLITVCSDCSTNRLVPVSLPLLGTPYSLTHNKSEIRSVNNPTMASKCSVKGRPISHFLNQKLEMIVISEEGISKAKTD